MGIWALNDKKFMGLGGDIMRSKRGVIIVALVPVLLGSLLLAGCIPGRTEEYEGQKAEKAGALRDTYHYSFSLKVTTPEEAKQKYGEGTITSMGENEWIYEDGLIRLSFLFPEEGITGINFSMENKTDHSIKIVWDEAAYLDEDNFSHRVMHYGVKYIERDQPQPPSIIIPRSKIEDIIYPADYVKWEKVLGKTKEWTQQPLLPGGAATMWGRKLSSPPFPANREEAVKELEKRNDEAKKIKGKKIGILLPLQVGDVINEYIFTFEITDIQIEKGETAPLPPWLR